MAILGIALFLLLPTLAFPFGYDQGVLHYLGWAVSRGEWPYRDAWDTAFPGAILVHAGTIEVLGNTVVAFRIVDLGWQLATVATLFKCGARLGGSMAGCYAAFAYAIAYRATGYYHTAQRDSFLVLPLMLSLLAGWRFLDGGRQRDSLASGLWLGIATLFRPTYALVALIGALYLAFGRASRAAARQRFAEAARFGAVAALPMLLFVATFVAAGNGTALWDLGLALTTVYPGLERYSLPGLIKGAFDAVPALVWMGLGAACLTPTRGSGLLFALAGVCVAIRILESKGFRYQYWPLMACLIPVAGMGWKTLADRVAQVMLGSRRRLEQLTGTAVSVGVVLVAQYFSGPNRGYRALARIPQAVQERYSSFVADDPNQAALARHISDHTDATDSVQLFGPMPGVLVAAERRSATRFTNPFLLLCVHQSASVPFQECEASRRPRLQNEFYHEILSVLGARPPRYIAAHLVGGSLAVSEGPCLAPDWPELRAIIDQDYDREATFGSWSAFRRKAP